MADRFSRIGRFSWLFLILAMVPACGYGPSVTQGSVEVHYKDGATKEEADRVAAFFNKGAPGGNRRSIQITKTGDGYALRRVMNLESHQDANIHALMEIDAARCSREAFAGAAVETHVCDERLKTVRALPHRPDLRYSIIDNQLEVFYAAPEDKNAAERLAKLLFTEMKVNQGATVKLARRDKLVEVHIVVAPGTIDNPAQLAVWRNDAKTLSAKVFDGAPVEMHLCDNRIKSIKALEP